MLGRGRGKWIHFTAPQQYGKSSKNIIRYQAPFLSAAGTVRVYPLAFFVAIVGSMVEEFAYGLSKPSCIGQHGFLRDFPFILVSSLLSIPYTCKGTVLSKFNLNISRGRAMAFVK